MEAAVERLSEDRTTRLRVWSTLARAALRVGDFSTALGYFAREEAEGLDPVWEPRNAYGVGLCRLAMEDVIGARRAFLRATSRSLDTHHDRLPGERLSNWTPPMHRTIFRQPCRRRLRQHGDFHGYA